MQQDTAISSDTISSLFRLRTKDTENTDSFYYRQGSFHSFRFLISISQNAKSANELFIRHLSWKTMNRGLIIYSWFKRFDNFKQSQPSILNVKFLNGEKIWTGTSFPNVLTLPFMILGRNCYLCEEFSSKVVRVGDRGDESARGL